MGITKMSVGELLGALFILMLCASAILKFSDDFKNVIWPAIKKPVIIFVSLVVLYLLITQVLGIDISKWVTFF